MQPRIAWNCYTSNAQGKQNHPNHLRQHSVATDAHARHQHKGSTLQTLLNGAVIRQMQTCQESALQTGLPAWTARLNQVQYPKERPTYYA
jgi:LmbE family N-acetylglucosaminyl deacetylase